MAIYDCFQFFDEEHVLDLRFNILNEFVDFLNPRLKILIKNNQPKKPKTFQNLISSIIKPALVTTLDIEFFVYLLICPSLISNLDKRKGKAGTVTTNVPFGFSNECKIVNAKLSS